MDRLRPRKRKIPSEFTNSEVQELEYYVKELGEQSLNQKFCAKIADAFSCSVGRAGKSRVTWGEIQRWLQDKHRELMEKAESIPVQPDQHAKLPDGDGCTPVNSLEQCQAIGVPSSSELNEDSNEPVKVQEQCIAILTQVPSPFQFNGSTYQPDASLNLVVPANESLRIKAQQSTTHVPSSTQTHIKGCTHLPGVSEPCMTFPAARIPNGAGDTNKLLRGRSFLIYQKWSSRLDLRKMKHGEFSSRRMVLRFGPCRIASLSLKVTTSSLVALGEFSCQPGLGGYHRLVHLS